MISAMVPSIRPPPPVVLVVEDEPLLRMHAVDIIEDAGFPVIEAHDASEAIEILGGRPDIGIVFTDIDMPGSMDGLMLAAAIRDRWPPIALIITSGKFVPRAEDMPSGGRFFSKPLDTRRLVQALRSLSSC